MADTIREQIIAAFTVRAQVLSNNVVERVRRSHPEGYNRNVSIWDGEDTAEGKEFGIQKLSFPIALNMQWEVQDNASIEANAVIGDTIQTMLSTDSTFSGLAEKMDYVSATPEYPAEGSGIVSLTVIFNIYYSTKLGDPFTAVS